MSLIEFFADHTYRMVFIGTVIIGCTAGALGTFAYLRKQSLISDVISHAALPGTLTAFLLGVLVFGGTGRNLSALIIGAVIAGTLAVTLANSVAKRTKTPIDAAMAISLTVFFGAGMLLMRLITDGDYPGKGGVQDYLFGNASVITVSDIWASIIVAAIALGLMLVFWKEFAVRTFDRDQVALLGFHPRVIDLLMYTSIVLATVIGIKAVGLVLMVAFVVTPPAAARQWTRTLRATVVLSATFGAVGSGLGAYVSIAIGGLPTGPVIVLTLFALFIVSLVFAPRRSIIAIALSRARTRRHVRAVLRAEASS